MVEKCPMAITKYFEEREMKSPWGLSLTKGNLKMADETVNFGVLTYPMEYLRSCDLESKLFNKESRIQEALRMKHN